MVPEMLNDVTNVSIPALCLMAGLTIIICCCMGKCHMGHKNGKTTIDIGGDATKR